MSSVTIVTDLFRASHVHLKERKQFQAKDDPAFRVAALFPQDGVGEIPALGVSFESSPENVMAAVKEVVMSEFNFDYDFYDEKANKMMGIEYGPYVKDGNEVLKKDASGHPIVGEYCPISAGNFIFNFKNVDDVACASGVDLKPIDVSAPYSGCWGRAQLEVSAFTTKGNTPSRIISIKMINFLMCYDDESFGGRGPVQSADQAFAGMEVPDSNLSVATGNNNFRPEGANKAPVKPVSKSSTGAVVMNADSEYTYQELLDGKFSDQDMIDNGYATKAPVKPVKKAPVKPVKKAPPIKKAPVKPVKSVPTTGTVTMNADSEFTYQELLDSEYTDQDMIDEGYATKAVVKPSLPVKKAPVKPVKKSPPVKPTKSVPTTGTVIMIDGSEYTYEQLSKEFEWTDEEIVNGGYATPNFTNPQ